MLMSPRTSLRSEQTAGGMLTSPARSMLSSRLDAPPHVGDAGGTPATATGGSAAASAMVTPRSMGGRGSFGDSMTSSRTLTVAGDAAQGQGAALQQSAQRKAPSVQGGRGDARRQAARRLQPQAQQLTLAAVAKEELLRTTSCSQSNDAAMPAKQTLPPPPEEHEKVHLALGSPRP